MIASAQYVHRDQLVLWASLLFHFRYKDARVFYLQSSSKHTTGKPKSTREACLPKFLLTSPAKLAQVRESYNTGRAMKEVVAWENLNWLPMYMPNWANLTFWAIMATKSLVVPPNWLHSPHRREQTCPVASNPLPLSLFAPSKALSTLVPPLMDPPHPPLHFLY